MNKKGFTLIELLVTIIVLGVVLVVAYTTGINIYDNAKVKNEDIFVSRLSDRINEYISLNNSDIIFDSNVYTTVNKETSENGVNVYRSSNRISLNELINNNLTDKIVNPRNKKSDCTNSSFYVYKDTDYVYCFSMNLECLERDNKLVTNCSFEVES